MRVYKSCIVWDCDMIKMHVILVVHLYTQKCTYKLVFIVYNFVSKQVVLNFRNYVLICARTSLQRSMILDVCVPQTVVTDRTCDNMTTWNHRRRRCRHGRPSVVHRTYRARMPLRSSAGRVLGSPHLGDGNSSK